MIMDDNSMNATIPMLLYGLITITGTDISRELSALQNPVNFKMAASVLSILPIIIIFLIFNKPIIRGISNRNAGSSTKG
jgi:multiple sugar transport system permease protein